MIVRAITVAMSFVLASQAVAQDAEEAPSMQCDIGPVNRSYGGSQWLIYGCADGQTLVFITPQGEPASPFYFLSFVRDGERRLYGEGNAPREATAPAYEELSRLDAADIDVLLAETAASSGAD